MTTTGNNVVAAMRAAWVRGWRRTNTLRVVGGRSTRPGVMCAIRRNTEGGDAA